MQLKKRLDKKRILIVHLISIGDCLMMTTIARQIKMDNPGCHLTWAISYKCSHVLKNNLDIDCIWEVKYGETDNPMGNVWEKVKKEAQQKKKQKLFDEIIYSQIAPDNYHHFDGTTRSSTFRAYPKPIRVNVDPILNLTTEEENNARQFVLKHSFTQYQNVVLCECAPSSGQSFLNISIMVDIANRIVARRMDVIFIISTHTKIETNHSRVIDASALTYRENLALAFHCNLFVGCSSGITWLLTSSSAKKINMLQFLQNSDQPFRFASIAYDFLYWGKEIDHILETDNSDLNSMEQIIIDSIDNFESAKMKHNITLSPSLDALKGCLYYCLMKPRISAVFNAYMCTRAFFKRNAIKKSAEIFFVYQTAQLIKNKVKNVVKGTYRMHSLFLL